MPTECSPALFDVAPVEGRAVVAGFDGGAITSNAGALLLGATDHAINLVSRFAACFRDARTPERVEHDVATLVGQRIFGIALGHEDVVTTTNFATTRCWRCLPASSRPGAAIASRWPASRR